MNSKMPRRMLTAAGIITAIFVGISNGAAQTIENGIGVICESPQQVEQFISLDIDSTTAVEQINLENKGRVCEIRGVAFLVGGIVSEASNDKGVWQIRKILIVGLYVGRRMSPVQPYEKFTAFLMSKAAPI
jgi:hypothetical protein